MPLCGLYERRIRMTKRKIFIPNIFLVRILTLSSHPGPDLLLEDIFSSLNNYLVGESTSIPQTNIGSRYLFLTHNR